MTALVVTILLISATLLFLALDWSFMAAVFGFASGAYFRELDGMVGI